MARWGMRRTEKDVVASGDLILNLFRGGYLKPEQAGDKDLLDALEKMLITGMALAIEAPAWSEEFLGRIRKEHVDPATDMVKRKSFVASFINEHRWEDDD
jgi:hypothetical protein